MMIERVIASGPENTEFDIVHYIHTHSKLKIRLFH